jgi:hypothetical protein
MGHLSASVRVRQALRGWVVTTKAKDNLPLSSRNDMLYPVLVLHQWYTTGQLLPHVRWAARAGQAQKLQESVGRPFPTVFGSPSRAAPTRELEVASMRTTRNRCPYVYARLESPPSLSPRSRLDAAVPRPVALFIQQRAEARCMCRGFAPNS